MLAKPIDKVMLVDENGEVLADEVLLIGKEPINKRVKKDKGFVKIFISFLSDVVSDSEVAGKSIRLLLYAIEKLNYNTLQVYLYPDDVMLDLGISRPTYFNWIKTLQEKGYLVKIKPYIYELKPYSFVKGTMSETIDNHLKEEIKEIR